MDEKAELARRINLGPRPDISDSDTDSEFDEREALVTPRTPTTQNGEHGGDLPPTYEESQAALRSPPAQPTTHPPVPDYNADIAVYRTEVPPDPPIVASDEKQPILSDPDGPQASRILNEALRFTETPPPTAERQPLRVPVAIPSFAGETSPVRFARFYAPALYPHSVADTEFIEFVDGLNNLAIAANYSAAAYELYHAQHGINPPRSVTRDDENIGQNQLVAAYLTLSNSHFFHPRGLHVRVVNLLQLAEHLNIGNEAIKKTIMQEVIRMARTGVDVPAAANGAAHEAAAALVPYVEILTTAVPEPRKNQEALHAVATRFASLGLGTPFDEDVLDAAALDEGICRSQTTTSTSSSAGPSRSKTWGEWGNDIGQFWGNWGEKQGEFWGRWGEEQGRKWGQWGQDFGRKVEKMASGPPTWVAGPSKYGGGHAPPGSRGPFGGGSGMHNRWGSHGWTGRPDEWGGRHGSFPWTPHGGPHHPHHPHHPHPMGGFRGRSLPHGVVPGVHTPPIPPIPPLPPIVPGVAAPPPSPPPPAASGAVVPMPPHPPMPGAFPLHQPLPSDGIGPHRGREDGAYKDGEEDEQDFDDVADKLSLSSVSDSSSDSDSDDETLADENINHAEDPDIIFAQKAEYIENMAAAARARHSKPAEQIEEERAKALTSLEHQYQRATSRRSYQAKKRELRKEVRAWKRSVRAELKGTKTMDKQERKAWKQTRKADWRGFKQRMKAQEREYRQERRTHQRQRKEAAKKAKREGKQKRWEDKRQHRDKRRRGDACGASERSRETIVTQSAESLQDDVYAQAREMLWIMVTKHDG